MRHRVSGRHFGRDSAHRKAMYRNLVTDLLRFERITTTEAKAKEIRPMTERIITLAKRGDIHARRQALAFVYDPRVVKHVFDDIAPRMANRPGGYLRITKLEPRKGDGAAMATIELVDYVDAPPTPRPQRVTAAPATAPARAAAAPAVASPAADEAEGEFPDDVVTTDDTSEAILTGSAEVETDIAAGKEEVEPAVAEEETTPAEAEAGDTAEAILTGSPEVESESAPEAAAEAEGEESKDS